MDASNEGSGETAHLRRLVRAFFNQISGYVPKSNTYMLAQMDDWRIREKDHLYIYSSIVQSTKLHATVFLANGLR